jgi:hypothetical protein
MSLSLDRIRRVNIPLNVSNKPNNLAQSQAGIQMYNDSVNLYEAILLATAAITSTTDLVPTFDATTVTITPSTGTAAIITAATSLQAGVMTATQVTNLSALIALDGVAPGATNLGTFSGNIITTNTTIKNALQELEIAIETAGSPTLGDILSTTLTITGGTNKVFNTDVTIDVDPSSIDITDLTGTILLTQFPDGTTSGDTFIWDGTEWTIDQPTVSAHNSLSSIQGGLSNERYHVALSLYNKLTASPTNRLIGRSTAGTGEIEAITPTNSIVLSGGNLSLTNDSASPGNSYYYGTNGSGTKGYHVLSNGSVTTVTGVDNADLEWTITNPTTAPALEVTLLPTTVTAGSYGAPANTLTLTVDANGRLTALNTAPIQIATSQITSFTSAVDTIVASNITAGTGITVDETTPGTIIIASTATAYTDEEAQDAVGTILVDSSNIDFTYTDATPEITADLTDTGVTADGYGDTAGTSYGAFSVDSKGRLTYAQTVPIAISSTAVTNFSEAVDDRVSNLLVAGTNITLNYNDVANTLTIGSTVATSSYTIVQSMGVAMPQQPFLNFNTDGFQVANDGANTRTNVGLTSNLAQIGTITTTGFFTRDSGGTINMREIDVSGNGIQITNGDGIAGNPTLSLDLIGAFEDLVAPAADRIYFYDFSTLSSSLLELGTGLSITGTTLNAAFAGALDDLSDVIITAPTSGQIVRYNGTNWVNYTPTFITLVDTPDPGDMIYYYAGQWYVITPLTEVFISLTGNMVTVANVISPNTEPKVYFNGLRVEEGSDYSVNMLTGEFTFIATFVPADKVLIDYFTAT